MSVASIGLPNSIQTSFFSAGSSAAGATNYLRLDSGDQQSFTLLASGDFSSPDYGNLSILSKAAGPSVVQRPLVIKPDGSVNVQSLTVAGVPYVPGGGGGGSAGVATVNGLAGAVTLAGAGAISVAAEGQTVTISSTSTAPITGPQATVGPGAAGTATLLAFATLVGTYMVKIDVQVGGTRYPNACVCFTAYSDGTRLYQRDAGPGAFCFASLNNATLNDWSIGIADNATDLIVNQTALPGAGSASQVQATAYKIG